MDAPTIPDPAQVLPKAIYYQVAHTLRALLPAPATDAPQDEARRDIAAIAHVAALLPANAAEADMAMQCVAASVWALDCLRQARRHADDTAQFLKCTAQAASMMRQARSWRSALLRAQAAREKRDADAATRTEHQALGLMAEALVIPEPAAPPKPEPIAEAERYALHHRKRAMLIRRLRRVPEKLNIGPIAPEVVQAIVTGSTPILRALDEKPRRFAA